MNLMKLIVFSMFAMLLSACGGDGSGLPSQGSGGGNASMPIRSLQVTPAIAAVPIGLNQQFFVAALLDDGTIIDVTDNPIVSWHSSNTSVATIDNKGLATGVAPGNVTITASGTANGQQF
ncbi:Ig-like domain-containing protein, partial [Aeromonas sobria]|uniref:Ig-like domain-containing protein n=3 Tax=Aeromonas sobria TaxID=646 RepID=UPI001BCC4920